MNALHPRVLSIGLAAVLGMALVPALAIPTSVDRDDPNHSIDAKASERSSASVAMLMQVMQTIRYARDYESPLAMLAAVDMLDKVAVPTEGAGLQKDGDPDSESPEAKPDDAPPMTLDAETLLGEARKWAADDDALLALIEERESTRRPAPPQTMGAVGGPKMTIERVMAGTTDTYRVRFRARELARVVVIGDGDTDLDLIIYDASGNLITQDIRVTDFVFAQWTPRWEGEFVIHVKNHGRVYNQYIIVTN